uniref:GTPase IMAP family member 9-like n=1 Tax=Epinephelus lanceolatus TaxID=310571 RepID=UPI001445840E|nr:GTPase IMAP family member 9-like [Epinephelus lanceolatus]
MRWKLKYSEQDIHSDKTLKISYSFKKEMASEDNLLPAEQLRIVLVGKVQAGKTSVMNALLRYPEEDEELASKGQTLLIPYTQKCQREEVKVGRQNVVVVDTPGLCHAEKEDEEVMAEIKQCVSLAEPGPHVFLFVMELETFTDEGQDMVKIIKKTFGENMVDYSMVLFTHGNELQRATRTIEEFIGEGNLKNFVEECKGGCHVIENEDHSPSQVTELLKKINYMVQENKGNFYTTKMFQDAQKEANGPDVRKKISLSVGGSALAGAGVGGAISYFAGAGLATTAGAAAGAAV